MIKGPAGSAPRDRHHGRGRQRVLLGSPSVTRHYDYLSKLGVRIHDPRSWSVALDPSREWFGYAVSGARFHTTQDRVWLDAVEAKKRLIYRWESPYVTTVDAPELGRGDMWVSNGHHTLAAYLVLGMRPYVRCFNRGLGPTAIRPTVPRFDPWART
jgi:hypothetical protein